LGTGGLFLRKLRARLADEPTGFAWVEKGRLAGSGYPASRAQVEWLFRAGIRSILTLTENPLPSEFSSGVGVTAGHVAMEDHQAPSAEAMAMAVDFIEEQLEGGRPVLVHCLAGEGRTGCVLAAYLIESKKIGANQALAELRKVKGGFVEKGQEKAVYDFASARKL
jgi:atypical dual specificity phosphatase